MCGIFGQISELFVSRKDVESLARHAEQRGKDSSGLLYFQDHAYKVYRSDYDIEKLILKTKPFQSRLVLGHSRLITNGLGDNQPVVRNMTCALHNGIIVNEAEVWGKLKAKRLLQIDSEVILGITEDHFRDGGKITELPGRILALCKGVIACALVIVEHGKLLLFSNNGSLYYGRNESGVAFASEIFALTQIGCQDIKQIKRDAVFIDIPSTTKEISISNDSYRKDNLIPGLLFNKDEEALLEYKNHNLKRCVKCVLPETMPFIKFDSAGVCNYCKNYKLRNKPKPKEELFNLVEKYRREKGNDCIVPFSGGRDSCYGLHLVVNELKMKPVTYTYDWGMVTDLGRRNISRMCAELGVENIIVAADISQKRKNIAMNLKAWLKSPHLGMISVLTAGDKHFFRYVETIKRQTGINLNLWGVNPLEVTHFKAGFLGIKPDFEEERVYAHGALKQINYQYKRLKAMLESPGYFNSSLWDTLSGEYYRSFTEKKDYYHIFDYWRWDEKLIEDTLETYDWEKAVDTNTTWRIGDGTAGFYNYVYYTVAGFTEHDTFRSNQIREGEMTREKAMELVIDENRPRYPNVRWYLDVLGMDFKEVIKVVNSIPKLFPVE